MHRINKIKPVTLLILMMLMYLSCDDRLPDDVTTTNASITLTNIQPVTEDGTFVGSSNDNPTNAP